MRQRGVVCVCGGGLGGRGREMGGKRVLADSSLVIVNLGF